MVSNLRHVSWSVSKKTKANGVLKLAENVELFNRWFSPDVTAAMLVYRTIEKKVFWEFDSIMMQNMSHNLLLFCAPTWRLIT